MNFYTANASDRTAFNAFMVRHAASCICPMVRRVLKDLPILLQVILLYDIRGEALLKSCQHNSMYTVCQAAQLNHIVAERCF